MHSSADFTSTLFAGLWRASWQATVLIGLVVLLQRLLHRRLTPPWRHALWLLVLARLLLPATPATLWSLFNWLPGRVVPAPVTEAPATASAPVLEPAGTEITSGASTALRIPSPGGQEPRSVLRPVAAPVPAPARFVPTAPPAVAAAPGPDGFAAPVAAGETAPRPDLPTVVRTPLGTWLWSSLWLAGVLALAARVVWTSARFRRALRGGCPVTDEDFAALLAECRQRLRVRRAVEAIETERVQSPALCGWWRPRLLLPVGLTCRLTREELRHVLLHELAHLKRGDICVNWLATAAQVLHWFNPAVWYGLRRLRAERELAADHLALTALGGPRARAYGQTVLKLLEDFARPVAGPAAVGILEGRDAIRERIAAVAAFRQPGRWSSLAGLLFVGLGLVSLTDARPRAAGAARDNASSATPVESAPTDNASRFQPLNLPPAYVTRPERLQPGMAWSAIPKERQIIGGVPFDLIKAAGLNGVEALNAHAERDWPLPRRIIATLGECRQLAALHLLLASGQARPPAKSIGKLILHFADGTTGELPLHDNEPLRELRIDRTTEAGHASPTGTHLILTSARPEEGDSSARIRFVPRSPDQSPSPSASKPGTCGVYS